MSSTVTANPIDSRPPPTPTLQTSPIPTSPTPTVTPSSVSRVGASATVIVPAVSPSKAAGRGAGCRSVQKSRAPVPILPKQIPTVVSIPVSLAPRPGIENINKSAAANTHAPPLEYNYNSNNSSQRNGKISVNIAMTPVKREDEEVLLSNHVSPTITNITTTTTTTTTPTTPTTGATTANSPSVPTTDKQKRSTRPRAFTEADDLTLIEFWKLNYILYCQSSKLAFARRAAEYLNKLFCNTANKLNNNPNNSDRTPTHEKQVHNKICYLLRRYEFVLHKYTSGDRYDHNGNKIIISLPKCDNDFPYFSKMYGFMTVQPAATICRKRKPSRYSSNVTSLPDVVIPPPPPPPLTPNEQEQSQLLVSMHAPSPPTLTSTKTNNKTNITHAMGTVAQSLHGQLQQQMNVQQEHEHREQQQQTINENLIVNINTMSSEIVDMNQEDTVDQRRPVKARRIDNNDNEISAAGDVNGAVMNNKQNNSLNMNGGDRNSGDRQNVNDISGEEMDDQTNNINEMEGLTGGGEEEQQEEQQRQGQDQDDEEDTDNGGEEEEEKLIEDDEVQEIEEEEEEEEDQQIHTEDEEHDDEDDEIIVVPVSQHQQTYRTSQVNTGGIRELCEEQRHERKCINHQQQQEIEGEELSIRKEELELRRKEVKRLDCELNLRRKDMELRRLEMMSLLEMKLIRELRESAKTFKDIGMGKNAAKCMEKVAILLKL